MEALEFLSLADPQYVKLLTTCDKLEMSFQPANKLFNAKTQLYWLCADLNEQGILYQR